MEPPPRRRLEGVEEGTDRARPAWHSSGETEVF